MLCCSTSVTLEAFRCPPALVGSGEFRTARVAVVGAVAIAIVRTEEPRRTTRH